MDNGASGAAKGYSADDRPVIPGTALVVRPVRGGDANRILTLMREVFIDEMGWDRAFLADAARTLVELLAAAGARDLFLVCCDDKRIVGLVVLRDAGDGTAFLRWLAVHSSVRGISLGRLLLGRALDFAADAGFARVRLVTVRDLSRALEFYVRAGFREVARKPDILWRMSHDLCFMELEVTPQMQRFRDPSIDE